MTRELSRGCQAFTIVLFALIILVFPVGCSKTNDQGQPSKRPDLYAMNVVVSEVPFWSESKATWSTLGKKFNVETRFGGPTNDDSQKQINELETLIAQGVKGIVVAPTDSKALTPIINRAVDSGIVVVTFLVDAPDSRRMTYITSTLEEASMSVGQFAVQSKMPQGGVIISLGTSGSEEQQRRANGFKQIANVNPGMKIVDVVEDKFDAQKGADAIKSILLKHKNIKYIFGCNSRSAAAAQLALKELRFKPGDITITAWDKDEDVLNLIESGWVLVSAVQQTTFMTMLAFDVLHASANNYLYPTNMNLKNHGVAPLPSKIEIPITLVTIGNAAAYHQTKRD